MPCECDSSLFESGQGLCKRHNCLKTAHWASLCRGTPNYFEAWEAGRGPCLGSPQVLEYCKMELVRDAWQCPKCKRRWSGDLGDRRWVCNWRTVATRDAGPIIAGSPATCCGGPNIRAVDQPNFLRRAMNFTRSMVDFAASGFKMAGQLEIIGRENTCRTCPSQDGDWCRGCGCYLPAKQKSAVSSCPLGLWPGSDRAWEPHVHDDWLDKVCVVIPTMNEPWLADCIADCGREGVWRDVRMEAGTWVEKCNAGLTEGLVDPDMKYEFFVLLNDDVRLSKGFFSGLLLAQLQTGGDSVSACYNVGRTYQKPEKQDQPPADRYMPRPVHRQVGCTDGTAVLLTRKALEAVGLLDAEHFGQHGWGAIDDLQMRMKQLGMTIWVTEAAYAYHLNMQTATKVHGSYEKYIQLAGEEYLKGLRAKWGQDFAKLQGELTLMPPITRRNVIYHVYPDGNYEWNIKQLLKHIKLFNGKKIACIVGGVNKENMMRAMEMLVEHEFTLLTRENDTKMGDSIAFLDMLGMVESTDPTEGTFFGHTKGAYNKRDPRWAEQMYRELLTNGKLALEQLRLFGCVGTAILEAPAAHLPAGNHWHFSGSFCWFNHAKLFTREWKKHKAQDRYFCEGYPSLMFDREEACNLGPTFQNRDWS